MTRMARALLLHFQLDLERAGISKAFTWRIFITSPSRSVTCISTRCATFVEMASSRSGWAPLLRISMYATPTFAPGGVARDHGCRIWISPFSWL